LPSLVPSSSRVMLAGVRREQSLHLSFFSSVAL
jgi:hypothetical protein